LKQAADLGPFATDTASELNILGHDCHTLGVDCTQVGILEKTDQVRLSSLLEGEDSSRLETKVRFEVLSNLANKALERSFADEEIGGLLVLANFSEGDGSGTVAVGLLHTTGGGSRLAGSLSR
jgi:hypothetical protein